MHADFCLQLVRSFVCLPSSSCSLQQQQQQQQQQLKQLKPATVTKLGNSFKKCLPIRETPNVWVRTYRSPALTSTTTHCALKIQILHTIGHKKREIYYVFTSEQYAHPGNKNPTCLYCLYGVALNVCLYSIPAILCVYIPWSICPYSRNLLPSSMKQLKSGKFKCISLPTKNWFVSKMTGTNRYINETLNMQKVVGILAPSQKSPDGTLKIVCPFQVP